ncbi:MULTISPECIES: NPCBM/NEW2 domain-containing protein [unclassified Streptomyces]|uniref:NPCBM/NEW2 domain-containing protein n=1 Tax=unclassified Streptomyces TaxID=2593676 RepID=UPI000883DC8B|nr:MULTISPECIES: NPCBM/NEW2 domain-containing protein [unclassified Streptomyces]PBC81490.1 alpha-galactosidase-like protein [Streptomyces sp. 2321.6]SDR54738.1 NPCBM-associated, NEW3 domain of alpha-galactosidase [Streptomyces sp. KS_16]SEC17441.1 NPCBM-associated, NEW3 domain of alpha-galactosidase [Streptomyces sp. 2133.1]SNC65598.1 NPCBM-associated, NEW3 domain of alpha-galactosidase [Streptomyces sp. 2114.4]
MRKPTGLRVAVVAALLGLVAAVAGPAGSVRADGRAPDRTVGDVTGFAADGPVYRLHAGRAEARVSFVTDRIFRIELAPDGTFTDPTGKDIVLPQGAPPATHWRDAKDAYELSTSQVTLKAFKAPLRFELRRADGSLVWSEAKGLSWDDTTTTQTLARGGDEQFYGAGMQNGRGNTSHRGHTVEVGVDYHWDDGGHPNSVPFYLSSAGYGVFRNTYAPNTYAFGRPVTTRAKERRFDAYYFAGPSAKDVIGQYTSLTGKPFLPPLYGLEIGDSDCYLHNANRGERHTLDALKVADGYTENDLPGGWMLVNDGYGCGYENLAETSQGLGERKMKLGLWTEDGIAKLADQVKAGQRIAKLDVAWVGDGYKFALDGCKDAYRGIEDNSDARGFTWAPESWSGAQRCGVQWSGDQSGSWDYIRWQIPTYAGATMSGLAYTTGDVDGIFGGSPHTYVRDLQWKSFLPAMMTMDGWAASDKQPYRQGEPYTSINRKYLKLKESLLPYMYSYAAEATRTGVGPVRPLSLEYPDDPKAATDAAKYEFLTGRDFLVAPVYQDTGTRDGIYLPKGTWIDYWTGRTYRGPATVDGYSAPLDTLPLFVRAGAAVPMWPGIRSYRDRTAHSPLAWDVYPQGRSSFTLYEDDGVTRAHRDGSSATQRVQVAAPRSGGGDVRIGVGALRGAFRGKQTARPYRFTVHTGDAPRGVTLDGRPLRRLPSAGAFEAADEGWFHDPADRAGVVRVKTASRPTGRAFTLLLKGASAVGGRTPGATVAVATPGGQEVTKGVPTSVRTALTAGTRAAHGVSVSLSAPKGWTVSAPVRHARIAAGATRRDTLTLTAPRDARSADPVTVTATVRYRSAGVPRTAVHRFEVRAVPPAPAADTWASDLEWLSQTNGYGPAERDRSNGESGAADGHPLTLAGKTYGKGIGTHADSDLEFFTGGRCTSFTADAGIDDEIADYGQVAFSVEGDGKVLWTSPKLTGTSAPVAVDVPLGGVRHVRLKVTDTDGKKSGDHGDWAGARFHCSG